MYVQMILYHSISFALFNIDFLIKKVLENKLINYAIKDILMNIVKYY